MANLQQKKRMLDFVSARIESSGLYLIKARDTSHVLAAERPDEAEQPKTIDVLLHPEKITVRELYQRVRQNAAQQVYTGHVFLKDGETFMVRLGVRGHIKDPRSLKLYPKTDIDSMIHLRDLESCVLRTTNELAYYQPETERLPESVRVYQMKGVTLDYSHIRRDNPAYRFAHNKSSLDYRRPVETATITGQGQLVFELGRNLGCVLARQAELVQARML